MEQDKTTQHKPVRSIWLGLFLISAGTLLVAYKLDIGIPEWLVNWPAAVITIGLLLGIYHRFKAGFWLIPVFWGGYLMAEQQAPWLHLGSYATAISFILAGVIFLMVRYAPSPVSKSRSMFGNESFVNITNFVGNAKRDVVTQDFKGADTTCVIGNTVIDLRNADLQQTALVDIIVFMGSVKIYIPEAWTVNNDLTTVFGDIKHSHTNLNAIVREDKLIRFDGTALFGAIEIISC